MRIRAVENFRKRIRQCVESDDHQLREIVLKAKLKKVVSLFVYVKRLFSEKVFGFTQLETCRNRMTI